MKFPVEKVVLGPESVAQSVFVQAAQSPARIFRETLAEDASLGLAIVGTRQPTPKSRQFLRESIAALRGSHLTIISGFALGIDSEAHAAALDSGLRTVAVVAGGLDLDYPRANSELRTQILEAVGLIISESPLRTYPYHSDFLLRNRLIARWSRATLVVEAAARSGALSTASWALKYGRDVYAIPTFPGDPCFAGNQRLLDEGAYPFWGPHSLGSSWANFSGFRLPARTQENSLFLPGFSIAKPGPRLGKNGLA
ncbi:MAG: DNA-processing protein DprA [Bdellovibrionota bacterium]